MLYAGGQWYEGIVVDVLNQRYALVRFDNYEPVEQIDFSRVPFRITRFGPEPVPQRRGKRKAPTSSRPSKRPRRSDSGDEDYRPTAGGAEEDHEEEYN